MFPPDTLIAGRYRVVHKIGQGGMGAVYEAVDERLRSTVALKQTLVTEEHLKKAFEREAHLLANLRHPNLPRVIDHFIDADGQFLVMDYITGKDLGEILTERGVAFPVELVLPWADQLLDVLHYLHDHDPPIIHRDIKPRNIKVTTANRVMLLDFGLAKGSAVQTRLTSSGSIMGYTPSYAPLEQIQGSGTDARSDIYSLGATLYNLLTSQIPVDALTRSLSHVNEEPDPQPTAHAVNPQVPATISTIVTQAMAMRAKDRPASAAEMRQQLQAAASHQATTMQAAWGMAFPQQSLQSSQQESIPQPEHYTSSEVLPSPALTVSLPSMPAPPPPEQAESAPPAKPRKPHRLWFAVSALVVVLLGVALAGMALMSKEQDNAASADDDAASTENTGEPMQPPAAVITRNNAEQIEELARFDAHTNMVYSVAFSPDGQTLASGSWDSTIILWDVATGQPVDEPLHGHEYNVEGIAFSPDGQTLASAACGEDGKHGDCTRGEIILWDMATKQPVGDPLRDYTTEVESVAFSPDGQILAWGGADDDVIMLWDVATGQPRSEPVYVHEGLVRSVAFSPDGQTLASGSWDQTIRLWDVATGQPIGKPLHGHEAEVESVAFSPDGQTLASGSYDNTIILWDVATGQPIGKPLHGHEAEVESVAFSPDGQTLASASWDATIILWDVATGAQIGDPLYGHDDIIFSVAFSPDGQTLASGSYDNTIILWGIAP